MAITEIVIWKENILKAIESTDKDTDSVGDTTLTKMMNRLQDLTTPQATAALDAIVSLVKEGPAHENAELWGRYWKGLAHLSYFLLNKNDEQLRNAFYDRLFGINKVEDYSSMYVLEGFVECSGKLSVEKLKKLDYIRKQTPLRWIDASIASSHFELAQREILQLIKSNTPLLNLILLSLHKWKGQWNSKMDFIGFVKKMRNMAQRDADKIIITEWLKRRDLS